MNTSNEVHYGPFSCLIYFLLDLFLTIEIVAIIFFNSDPFNLVPVGATHPETILFAIGLWIITEFIALKYSVFGVLGKWAREQRERNRA